jgi:hypothetical protein
MRTRANNLLFYIGLCGFVLSFLISGNANDAFNAMVSVMDFNWSYQDSSWKLAPSNITVKPVNGFFEIHAGDRPLNARYTSEHGAKLDAWQFAYAKRKALFGAYRIRLCA